jgi:nicotinate-nucleotide adenylyltransferase
MSRRKLTGLLGGSFHPAHGGQLRITLFAAKAL